MFSNLAFCAVYFFEMLISYIFFSQIGEKKYNIWLCLILGTAIFEIGALGNIIFSNTVWLNMITFILINLIFAVFCFKIKFSMALFYSIILDLFSAATEFSSIFIISALTHTETTAYNDNIFFFIIDASTSKCLYLITCMILANFIQREKSNNVKIPITLYFYSFVTGLALVTFWGICTNYDLSNNHQILLSAVCMTMFLSAVILFISYQNNIEKANQYFMIQKEMEKINIDKKYYDILEQQNRELMIYAHDTKNHLNAIRALNNNKEIDEYLSKMTDDLKAHSSACHCGNHMLDLIINKYVTECKIKNIDFDFDTRLSNLRVVNDYDLVTVLGNILDNAVESAYKSKEKHISLKTNKVNTYDSVIVTNSCDFHPESTDGELRTTKEDKKAHGLGIKSVKKILKKYKGDLEWEFDSKNKQFTTTVILK